MTHNEATERGRSTNYSGKDGKGGRIERIKCGGKYQIQIYEQDCRKNIKIL